MRTLPLGLVIEVKNGAENSVWKGYIWDAIGIFLDDAEPRSDDISMGKMVPLLILTSTGARKKNNYQMISCGSYKEECSDLRFADLILASIGM